MKRDPGKKHTILLNIISGFTNPWLAHIEKRYFMQMGSPVIISFQWLIPNLFHRAITCLSTHHCANAAFHLLLQTSKRLQSPVCSLWQWNGFCSKLCRRPLCAASTVTDLNKEKFSRLRRSSRIALMDYIFAYPTVITEDSQEKAHSFSTKHQLLYVDIYEGNITAVGSTAQPRLMKNWASFLLLQ